jgi:hypothetical protein
MDAVPTAVLNEPDALAPTPQARLLAIPVPRDGKGAGDSGVGAPPVAQASARARSPGMMATPKTRTPRRAGYKGRLFIVFGQILEFCRMFRGRLVPKARI